MAGGLFISADYNKLDDYVGPLSNAIIPVWDGTTGEPFKIAANSILIGGDTTIIQLSAAGGPIENISALHGKIALLVFRGNSKAGDLITTGTPNGQQVKWNNVSDDLTAPADADWYPGEPLTVLYKN